MGFYLNFIGHKKNKRHFFVYKLNRHSLPYTNYICFMKYLDLFIKKIVLKERASGPVFEHIITNDT